MLSHVPLKVTCKSTDRRLAEETRKPTSHCFNLLSPLLTAKPDSSATGERDKIWNNLPPFWALLRSGGPGTTPNMELQTIVVKDSPYTLQGDKQPAPNKHAHITMEIPVAINTQDISKGEILVLPPF